jgi:hypothetical protein
MIPLWMGGVAEVSSYNPFYNYFPFEESFELFVLLGSPYIENEWFAYSYMTNQ